MTRSHSLHRNRGIIAALLALQFACRDRDQSIVVVELPVADVRAAVAFYGKAFGWKPSYQDSSYALLGAGAASVAVEKRVSGGSGVRVVIRAKDLEATLATVTAQGAEIRSRITTSWRGRSFRCADPFGNELVVWSDQDP